jgi:Uncharacterised protein family, YAP/Alf4/glomulin
MAAASANCPSIHLRPLMYTLTEQILDLCPLSMRLYYIFDTLDYCPFENLRVAVINTFKKQISKSDVILSLI